MLTTDEIIRLSGFNKFQLSRLKNRGAITPSILCAQPPVADLWDIKDAISASAIKVLTDITSRKLFSDAIDNTIKEIDMYDLEDSVLLMNSNGEIRVVKDSETVFVCGAGVHVNLGRIINEVTEYIAHREQAAA